MATAASPKAEYPLPPKAKTYVCYGLQPSTFFPQFFNLCCLVLRQHFGQHGFDAKLQKRFLSKVSNELRPNPIMR
jgi:hypothetical protein